MKKIKLVFLWMTVFVLLLAAFPAHGESCYVALRELMSSKDQSDWYLGRGRSSSSDTSKVIYAVYVEKDEAFYILGVNEYGKGEITIWNNVELTRGYHMIYTLSYLWDTLQENMDKGYSIILGITDMASVEGDWVIDDAESAASFVQVIEATFASISGN